MNKQQITTKQLALCSVLLTLMLVLGWVESLFPPLMGVPGIKLGLSNGVLIFAVYMLSLPTAWVLMLLKVVLSSLFLGGVAALPYALAGGVAGKHVPSFAHEVDAPGHGQHCRQRDAQRRANRDGDDYPPHVAIGVLHGCPDAQRHSLRRADRRERHAGDEAHEAYQVGEIAKGGKGRPQTSSVFMLSCRLRRGETLCTTKIN